MSDNADAEAKSTDLVKEEVEGLAIDHVKKEGSQLASLPPASHGGKVSRVVGEPKQAPVWRLLMSAAARGSH